MEAVEQLSPAPSSQHWYCECCHTWVRPVRPHWGWRATEVAFWLSVPGALMMMKGLGAVAIPFLFIYAGGLAGPLRTKAGADAHCPTCERYMPPRRRSPRA